MKKYGFSCLIFLKIKKRLKQVKIGNVFSFLKEN
jgi:hypothetical protein